jgi:hypothetical protein
VRYEITLEPVFVYACHCADCQGSTSSAFSIGVMVPADGFRVIGDDNTRLIFGGTAASNGRVKQRRVCTHCGTWLYGDPRNHARYPGLIRVVRGGTFDDQTWITPMAHLWVKRAQPWIVIPDDVRKYDTQPDGKSLWPGWFLFERAGVPCHIRGMATTTAPSGDRQRHVVKRYAGSRLYDTTTLAYVTAPQLRALAAENTGVLVYEAETGADITQSVLASPW